MHNGLWFFPRKDHAQIDAQTGGLEGPDQSDAVSDGLSLATEQVAPLVAFSPTRSALIAPGVSFEMVGAVRFELTTSTSRT